MNTHPTTKPTFLLPDTNIFLHFRPLREIDWRCLASADSVTLLIAPVVIRELNRHKDLPRSDKLRDRAIKALRFLNACFKGEVGLHFPPSVKLEFLREPKIDFSSHELSKDIADDHLIASALDASFSREGFVFIVTDDLGLQIKAQGKTSVLGLPEELRLPYEVEPDRKRILELEKQLNELQLALPDLAVTTAGGASLHEMSLPDFENVSEADIEGKVSEARAKHPPMVLNTAESVVPSVVFDFSAVENARKEKFNEGLQRYYQHLRHYYEAVAAVRLWWSSTVELELWLRNTGGKPADDIDVYLHFPDGFEVLEYENLPDLPKEPLAPERPKSAIETLAGPSRMYMPRFDAMRMGEYPTIKTASVPNVTLGSIKKGNSYDVQMHIRQLKHQNSVKLPKLYLHFDSHQAGRSFRIDYYIVAANVPRRIEGLVDVKVIAR
jgi:hypothetical protein